MGCGCGGASRTYARSAAPPAAPGTTWEVVFPNQSRQPYAQEWQARAAKAVSGGSLFEIAVDGSRRQVE